MMIKKIGLVVMVLFYMLAGINHFLHRNFYLEIIPPYLPYPQLLNDLAGFFELAFAIMLYPPKTRELACWGIILMLIAFLPIHIYMVQLAQHGPYQLGNLSVTPFFAWLRIPFQFLFLIWAYWCSKLKFNILNQH